MIFADLVGFTEAARGLPPEEIVDFLDRPVRSFDALIAGRRLPASSAIGAKAQGGTIATLPRINSKTR